MPRFVRRWRGSITWKWVNIILHHRRRSIRRRGRRRRWQTLSSVGLYQSPSPLPRGLKSVNAPKKLVSRTPPLLAVLSNPSFNLADLDELEEYELDADDPQLPLRVT